MYKYESFPALIGQETSGTILALPTDSAVLNNETFKKQGFKVGGKVAAVSLILTNLANSTQTLSIRISLAAMRLIFPSRGNASILYQTPSPPRLQQQLSYRV